MAGATEFLSGALSPAEGALARGRGPNRRRIEGTCRIIFGIFFALSVSTVPVVARAGTLVLTVWGLVLPSLAMLACVLVLRIDPPDFGRGMARARLRTMLRGKLTTSFFAFFAGALPFQRGYIAADICRDVVWLLCVPVVFNFFRDRCWRAFGELVVLLLVALWLQNLSGSGTFAVFGAGVGAAWVLRGAIEALVRD
ncbi:MAG: hypothetical protein GXP31_01120 [Kiritimatiellaeota bacterium]|nr:hypothetical protein [Kiritimatiellota bacterium]